MKHKEWLIYTIFFDPIVSTEPDHPPLKRIKKEVDADIGFTESQSVKVLAFRYQKYWYSFISLF